jgi:hypothetical protein
MILQVDGKPARHAFYARTRLEKNPSVKRAELFPSKNRETRAGKRRKKRRTGISAERVRLSPINESIPTMS